jgi:hypothetical protein
LAGKSSPPNQIWTDPAIDAAQAAFVTQARIRLDVDVLPPHWRCSCGQLASNSHVFSCTKASNGPKQKRHDNICKLLVKSAEQHDLYVVREPRNTVRGTRKRPDVYYSSRAAMKPTFIDVTITIPHLSTAPNYDKVQGAAAAKKASNKTSRWKVLENQMTTFLPFALDCAGFFHSQALDVLTDLTSTSYERKALMGKVLSSLVEGNHYLFNSIIGDVPKISRVSLKA